MIFLHRGYIWTEVTQKKDFHYDFMILEITEARFPILFVSISNHRTSPFCLLL